MGDKSIKSKQRGQKQKDAGKTKSTAAAKSKQDSYSRPLQPWRRAKSSSPEGRGLKRGHFISGVHYRPRNLGFSSLMSQLRQKANAMGCNCDVEPSRRVSEQ